MIEELEDGEGKVGFWIGSTSWRQIWSKSGGKKARRARWRMTPAKNGGRVPGEDWSAHHRP